VEEKPEPMEVDEEKALEASYLEEIEK